MSRVKTKRYYQGPNLQILVRVLDPEMMQAIRNMAKRDKVSVAEAVRTLLTWGLEQAEKD